jgi:hypothetical protein
LDHLPDYPLKPEFEKRTIMGFEQPVRDMDAVIWVDPNQVGIEGRMMDLVSGRPFDTTGCPNCSSASMTIGIEQSRLGQMGDRTAASVGAQDGASRKDARSA